MIPFSKFLIESLDVDKLKHLEHAEDHIIHGGEEGLVHAADNLNDLHSLLTGGKSKSKVTTKYDGSPSVAFGINPENGKFFVGSKSVFNVNPKINYTEEDIDRNHGHAPGLAQKLKVALKHLPKVMPKDAKGAPSGVYQGDFLYDKNDLEDEDGKYKFAPNTITYAAPKDSSMGRKVGASQMGFVIHTKYKGKNLADMKAGFDVDHSKFKQDPDVNLVNPEINDTSKSVYSPVQQAEYNKHLEAATENYRNTSSDTLKNLGKHDAYIKPYINQTVRDGTTPSVDDYKSSLEDKRDKEVAKVKTEAAKQKKASVYDELITDLNNNKQDYGRAFAIHHHLQKAKDVLVSALGNPTEFEHTVGGKKVKPEGFVSIRNGRPTKLVDRAEFSRLNFANNRGRGESAPTEPDATKPDERDTKNPHVLAFGRMNPPTIGHGALVDKVKELATENKAKHTVVLSHSQDPEKNPLSAEQKIKHAKRFFPGANIQAATDEAPTFIHQAKKLHQQGVDHLIMVGGSDRVDEYKKILDKYNGPGKDFNFKRIDVVSAGERDPDAEGVSGMSASKMRAHAMNRNYTEFKKGIPQHVHPEHAKELYNEVRKAMHIEIGPDTSGIALGKYAKRDDEVGHRARAEQKRREQAKLASKSSSSRVSGKRPGTTTSATTSSASPSSRRISASASGSTSTKAKKTIKEERNFKGFSSFTQEKGIKEQTTTADIRGLGNISGNPAGDISNYASDNIATADTLNDVLKKFINTWHSKYHLSKVKK